MYGKLIDNELNIAPKNFADNGVTILNFDLDTELMTSHGFKLVVEAERPETIRLYHIGYNETENTIEEVIVYDETQEEAEERIEQDRRAHINSLKCTKRVFALILEQIGITYSQLKQLIATNERAQLEWELCVELLRENPLLDVFAEQLGISSEQLDNIFLYANGEINAENLVIPNNNEESGGEE